VQNVAQVAALGTVPLIIKAELRLAPTTDIIYQVPIDPAKVITYTRPDGVVVSRPEPGTKGDPAVVPTAKSGVISDDQW
jgi:hypothetical protein